MNNTVSAMGWPPVEAGGVNQPVSASPFTRLQMCEYAFYFIVFYAVTGSAYGFSVGSLGIVMHLGLAALCILRMGSGIVAILRPLSTIFLCGISFVAIQLFIHGSLLSNGYIRPFLAWLLTLIIIKTLFTRPGFFRRATTAIFLIGLSTMPFLDLNHVEGRAGLSASVLANPNDLAAWFGFCAVVFTIRGLEARQVLRRWIYWAIGLFSISIVALTVGRGALGAFAIALVVVLRKQLRRSFLPLLGVIMVVGGAFALGAFDQAIARYTERGVEETGRLLVWPLILQRVGASPLVGVPAAELGTSVYAGLDVTPHNALLFILLGGGVVPLLFFLIHWVRCFQGALKRSLPENPESAYLLPVLVYSFVTILTLNEAFMATWCVVIVCACANNLAEQGASQTPGRTFAVVPKHQPYREIPI